MNGKTTASIITALITAVAIWGGHRFVDHWATAQEDHKKIPELEDLTRANFKLIQELAQRAKDEDAKKTRDRELCIAGKITDTTICAMAGVDIENSR